MPFLTRCRVLSQLWNQIMSSAPAADEILELLSESELNSTVELRETHISQVFLTHRLAFKRKKQVKFDFLDYSTLAERRRQCEAEVALNSRLADDVYLGVVSLMRDGSGRLDLGGEGEPVEYLVKMRRLPDEQRLKSRIEQGRVQVENIESIAERLSEFYATAERPDLTPQQYAREVWQRIEANHGELSDSSHELPQESVLKLYRAQRRWMTFYRPLLEGRAAQGRIVDGHGDLRAEHVYLTPQPRFIDCIEFNDGFRRIDAADELAFLAMECDGLGAAWVGEQLFTAYCNSSGDDPPACLIAFYKCFRACVRAKVAAIRQVQTTGAAREANRQEALQLLGLAEGYLPAMRTARLVVVWGLSGSGKSTLAAAIAKAIEAVHLQTDLIRRDLQASDSGGSSDRYSPQRRQAVYDELLRRAEPLLAGGEAVVLDGTFLTAARRDACAQLAAGLEVPWLTVHCDCPSKVARQRICDRRRQPDHPSEAFVELVDEQLAQRELPTFDERNLQVDGTYDGDENAQSVTQRLIEPQHATEVREDILDIQELRDALDEDDFSDYRAFRKNDLDM